MQWIVSIVLTLCTASHAQSKPYLLASSDEFGIQFWKVDTLKRDYKLVATWKAPDRLTVRSISAFPKSRKLLVGAVSAGNSKVFTVSLSGDGKVSSIGHNWIGYGYPLISPSERTVAVVGWDGCHGYIDLQKREGCRAFKICSEGLRWSGSLDCRRVPATGNSWGGKLDQRGGADQAIQN